MSDQRLNALRAFARGEISEAALKADTDPADETGYDIEEDEEFIQECMAIAYPLIIQSELIGESADAAAGVYIEVQDYLIGQGIISEAAATSITNPKVNVVRMNKQAQIERLTAIYILKLARDAKMNEFKKYKLGQKIKTENFAIMSKRLRSKAERMAKQAYTEALRNGKVSASITAKKAKK